VLAVALALTVGASGAPAQGSGQVRAGVATVDASWHVGASAGQYASSCVPPSDRCTGVDHADGTFDPTGHSTLRLPSYGIQSRLSVRALVIEGPDGSRHAILKNDLYIPQDLVMRRAAQLIAAPSTPRPRGAPGPSRTSSTFASTSTWRSRWQRPSSTRATA